MASLRSRPKAALLIALGLCLLSASRLSGATVRRELFPSEPNSASESAIKKDSKSSSVLSVSGELSDEIVSSLAAGLAAVSTKVLSTPSALDCSLGPIVCKKLDCPEFKVLDRYEGFELRRYDPATFTSTVLSLDEEASIEKAAVKGFHRLIRYNFGDNEDDQKVPMTAPVLYALDVDRDASKRHDIRFADRFSVSFFVPFRYQDEPPRPSDPDVFLVDTDEKDIFVRPFGGYATGSRITRIASEFLRDLYDDGHKVDCRTVFIAQYSPPFQPIFRYNEVWVLRRRGRGQGAADSASAADVDIEDECGDWLKPSEEEVVAARKQQQQAVSGSGAEARKIQPSA